MRVGLVIYGSLDTVSGGYLYDRQLVRRLEQEGDEVKVISLPWRTYMRHLTDNRSADLLRRMSGDFDVLLQDELNHPSLAWANDRLGRDRPPIVAIVHHLRASEVRPGWQNRLYRLVERRYVRSVDAFIYNSYTTRRAVEALTGGRRPNLVAYPGGDRLTSPVTGALAAGRAQTGPLRLLFVGNLIARKSLHVLLAALAQVRGEWRLSVVGSPAADPDYARRVQCAAEHDGLDSRIAWRGGLSDDDLAAEMAAAHVLAVPSDYEGFGIVYVEGMGFGLPALATTAGATGEIITDGENGFLVAPGDASALAERIDALALDRDLLARMSAAALARSARHPAWAETTTAIRDFLLSVAAWERT
jgi:glycosyltransferase involved in cell wall biosynthesis